MESKQEVFDKLLADYKRVVLDNYGPGEVLHEYSETDSFVDGIRRRYAAASDETEAQERCEFCHGTPGRAEWRNDVWGLQAYVLGRRFHIYVRGQMDAFPITHCPMCGRFLGGEGDE